MESTATNPVADLDNNSV